MDNTGILQEMLYYIDTHIRKKMSVEILAERAGFSPVYFCKMFQNGVGTSIMEYVRNRRLAYAASELSSGRKLINIAQDYGFDTHSGFSKAFRRFFGCPPEIFRTHAVFKVPEIPDLTKKYQFEPGKIIEPKILANKAAFKIAGFSQINSKPELIYKFKKECKNDGRMERMHSEPFVKHHAEYGACCFTKSNEDDINLDVDFKIPTFVIGLEAKSGFKIPATYDIYSIPESLYAVFFTTLSIHDTWQYIFSEWLPNSSYEYDTNGINFEYFEGRSIIDPVCDIYIPVVKCQL